MGMVASLEDRRSSGCRLFCYSHTIREPKEPPKPGEPHEPPRPGPEPKELPEPGEPKELLEPGELNEPIRPTEPKELSEKLRNR